MAQDFRASQFRGAKFITSGSSAGGAKLVFYDISADSTGTPNQGVINTAKFNTSSIGTDVFLYVSGTVFGGSSPQVTVLPDTVLSGNITFRSGSGDTHGELGQGLHWIGLGEDGDDASLTLYKEPADVPLLSLTNTVGDIAFYTAAGGGKYFFNNGAAVFNAGLSGSLTRLADGSSYLVAGTNVTIVTNSNGNITISATGGGGGSGGSLQTAYLSGSTITLNTLTSSVKIVGNPGTVSSSLVITPTNSDERAISVYNNTGTDELVLVHGLDSTFGGGGVVFRSNGSLSGYIGWQDGSSLLTPGESVQDALVYYLASSDRLILKNNNTNGKISIWNRSADVPTLETLNGTNGSAYFFPNQSGGTLHNSGTLTQSGSAIFNNGLSGSLTKLKDGSSYLIAGSNVTITTGSNGAVTIAASGGGGGGDSVWVDNGSYVSTTASLAGAAYNPSIDSPYGAIIASFESTVHTDGLGADEGAGIFGGLYNYVGVELGGNGATDGSVIIGGYENTIKNSPYSFIGGGYQNGIYGETGDQRNAILGGDTNEILSSSYTMVVGTANTIFNHDSTVVIGSGNWLSGSGGSGNRNIVLGESWEFENDTDVIAVGNPTIFNPKKILISGSAGVFVGGQTVFNSGLSGSLTKLKDGTSYLIAGSNVTITTGSNGAVTIASTGGGGGGSPQWVESSTSPRLRTTASVAIGAGSVFAENVGSNVSFFVSGSVSNTDITKVAVLSNTIISGNVRFLQSSASAEPQISWYDNVGSKIGKLQMDTTSLPLTGVLILSNERANGVTLIGGGNLGLNVSNTHRFDNGINLDTLAADTFLEVSGATNSKGSSTRGVALFKGDTHTSGAVHMNNSAIVNSKITTNSDATLWTLNMSSSAVYDVDLTIVAVGTSSLQTRRFKRNLVAYTSGSTAAIMENTVFAPVLDVSGSSAASTWDVGFTVSGSSLLTNVTSSLGVTVTWTMKAEYTFGGNS